MIGAYLSPMIDDASRRRDEAFARKLKDWKRRRHGDCKLFWDACKDSIIPELEQNLAASALVRDFFDRRAQMRQAPSAPRDADHGHSRFRPGGE